MQGSNFMRDVYPRVSLCNVEMWCVHSLVDVTEVRQRERIWRVEIDIARNRLLTNVIFVIS